MSEISTLAYLLQQLGYVEDGPGLVYFPKRPDWPQGPCPPPAPPIQWILWFFPTGTAVQA
jgi:hypothetical protein